MPFFSVIVPNYNRTDLLKLCYESVLRQTFTDFELIIIDDASPSPDAPAAARLAATLDPRIKVIVREQNGGIAGARNSGIEVAKGRYLAFLDSDDCYVPWTLEYFHRVIESHREAPAFIASKPLRLEHDTLEFTAERDELNSQIFRDYLTYRRQVKDWWFSPSGVCLRADVVHRAGGFWPLRSYNEDVDMWTRIGREGPFVLISKPNLYGYRIHSGNSFGSPENMFAGLHNVITREKSGVYGPPDSDRTYALCLHISHRAYHLIKADRRSLAWRLYCETFSWHIKHLKIEFLLGVPVLIALRTIWKF